MHLAVHLENGQRVYFTEDNLHDKIKEAPRTTLTAFFLLCQKDKFAQTLMYCDVPKYYTWDACEKLFKRRVQGIVVSGYPDIKATDALGRVYTVHPNNFECFYLRMLLHSVRGPTSFEALRTINGRICATFREACQQLGLLEDDAQWNATLSEAAAVKSAESLRNLFVILLAMCSPSNSAQLWESYKESLTEDILIQARRQNTGITLDYTPDMFNQTLIFLEDKTLRLNGKDLKQIGLPTPKRTNMDRLSREMLRETSYNLNALKEYVLQNEPLLVIDQKAAYNAILDRINRKKGGIPFLDAPGGTGKTFVINLLLAKIRQQSKIALAVASSGIAATLLHGGRTAHSTLKLPLDLTQQEALNYTLQDLRGNQTLMGGVVLLLAGDFRQTLPVIPKGTMADELRACLKSSYLWRHIPSLKLNTNMRVHLQGDIAADLTNGLISFPENFCNIVDSVAILKSKVFPDIQQRFSDHKWLCERAILAPKNDSVNAINLQIQQQLPGEETLYKSIDTVVVTEQAVHYPTEFLNSLDPPWISIASFGAENWLSNHASKKFRCTTAL